MTATSPLRGAGPVAGESSGAQTSGIGLAHGELAAALVGIVIVNWNGWRDTLRCVDSLACLRHVRWKAIVVDNASSDESLANLRLIRGKVELIESEVNTGWAGGNNLGMRHAFQLGCNYVWLLNNDAVAMPDALVEMVALARSSPDIAFVGSLIDHDPPRDTYQFAGARRDPRSGIPEGLWDVSRDEIGATPAPILTDYVMGCSLLASRRIVERIGYLDEKYFLNFDETDWCRRAIDQGFRCLLVPNALVRHRHSGSMGGIERPLNQYFMIRNRLVFTSRHCTPKQRLHAWKLTLWDIDRFARLEGHRHWLMACLRRDTPLVRTALTAVRDYLVGRRGDCPASIRALHASTARKG